MEKNSNSDLSLLLQRVERLERQNGTLKCWGLAGLLVLGAFAAMGAAQTTKTLTAQKLVITDAGGNPRAVPGQPDIEIHSGS